MRRPLAVLACSLVVPSGAAPAQDDRPPAAAYRIDTSRLTARRDSMRILFDGQAIGAQVGELVYEGGWVVLRETTTLSSAGVHQQLIIRLDPATLAMQSLEQWGTAQGQPVLIDVTWKGGRVIGSAETPRAQAEPQGEIQIDTPLAPSVLESSTLQYLIPAMPLAVGDTSDIRVFNAASGREDVLQVAVTGREAITVPAAGFDAFRVEVTGGQADQILYVAATSPSRVVKIAIVGQPIVFELVGTRNGNVDRDG